MIRKRILIGVLFILLVTLFFSTTVLAKEPGILYMDTAYCEPGDEVALPIAIFENPGIISLDLEVVYDEEIMTLKTVSEENRLPGAYHSDKFSSPYRLSWEDYLSEQNHTTKGVIVVLVFEVKETTPTGNYTVHLSCVRDGALNSALENVTFTCYSGNIRVRDEHVHSWSTTWTNSGSGGHSRYCECGESETKEHTWDEGIVTTPPQKGITGMKTYTCTVCGSISYERFYDEDLITDTPTIPSKPTRPSTPSKPATIYTCPYTDISNHWANDIIRYVDKLGLMDGMTATTFAPDKPMTREAFVIAMARLSGVESNYIGWAIDSGLLKGYGNGEYGLMDTITREQMAVFFLRFLELSEIDYEDCKTVAPYKFADDNQIADWAEKAVYEMQALDLIHGKGNRIFDPKGLTTRAEGATVLYNLCKTVLNK